MGTGVGVVPAVGLYRGDYAGVIQGLYRGCAGVVQGLYRDYAGVVGFYAWTIEVTVT